MKKVLALNQFKILMITILDLIKQKISHNSIADEDTIGKQNKDSGESINHFKKYISEEIDEDKNKCQKKNDHKSDQLCIPKIKL